MNAHTKPVLSSEEVAGWLGVTVETFRNKRPALEKSGFPPRLPGIAGWSRAAVLRWIETNGATYLPPADTRDQIGGDIAELSIQLEGEYAR